MQEELVDFFRNEPIARLWLSKEEEPVGPSLPLLDPHSSCSCSCSSSSASALQWEWEKAEEEEKEEEGGEEEWGAKKVGRKGKGVKRWPTGPSCGAAIQKRASPAAVAAWETVGAPAHPSIHAAPRVAPAFARAAAPASPATAAETKSALAPVHYHVQHTVPRVEVLEDPRLYTPEEVDELLYQLLLPRGMLYSVYAA